MARIQLKHKILFTMLGIFAVVVIIIIGIILPSLKYIKDIKQEIDFTEAQMEERYQKIRLLKKSINELKTIKSKTEKLKNIALDPGKELELIRQFENMAQEHYVIQSLDVSVGKEEYVFTLGITGTFHNLMNYLQKLETLPYYVSIPSLNWSKNKEGLMALKFKAHIPIK